MRKKVLIIGNSAVEYALAKKLSESCEIFVAPGSTTIKEFATCVDIREDSVSELLDFVLENEIDITIPVSKKAIYSNIVDIFMKNNQSIFAPNKDVADILFDKFSMKKLLYKLQIPTPKFGIFEKQNIAMDYLKKINLPFVIKTNSDTSAVIITTAKTSKNILDSIFTEKNAKVIIEDYIWGTPFAFYIVTDGYKALPIGSSILYKHSLEGNGGQLTSGMGACSPNYKLSFDNEYFIMDNIIYPTLEHLESIGTPYLGILGVTGVITEDDKIFILGYEPFLQNSDCMGILENLDTDIIALAESCIIGSFSDEFEQIPQKDFYTASLVLSCKNKDNKDNSIQGIETLDSMTTVSFYPQVQKNKYLEYEANSGLVMIITSKGRTVSSARDKVYDEAKSIKFDGIYYRKDICENKFD